MRILFLSLVLASAFFTAAQAQARYLTQREARATFIGVDMAGVHKPDGASWRECINRRGETKYWYGGRVDDGRLTIRDNGALCFSYASAGFREESCWRARPLGRGGYQFESVAGGSDTFIASSMRRVSGCDSSDTPIS